MAEAIQLLVTTVFLRPYVFLFLAFYLTAASVAIGGRRTDLFTGIAWGVASTAECSSTRHGIPFGFYSGAMLYYLILVFDLVMTFVNGEKLLEISGVFLYIPITWMVFTRYWQWGTAHRFVSRGVLS
ncbi:MAG: hypothetical protein KGL31_09910 [candidate division NC10 bacterium]|nr:hypothetical protein [candidate division NC10 bacterium]MDE2322212.1 hypothetical protein [candidate division NC10 bacterium]